MEKCKIKSEFKEIPFAHGKYSCDKFGNIRSNARRVHRPAGNDYNIESKILKWWINNQGYAIVSLRINGRTEDWLVHRLIAITWLPNPNNYPIINHKDNNPLNNRLSNLEWCTYSYNTLYAERQGRRPYTEAMKKARKMPKLYLYVPVDQLDMDGKYLMSYPSAIVAAKSVIRPGQKLKTVSENISWCCARRRNKDKYPNGDNFSINGYKWAYSSDFTDNYKV